MNIFEFSTLFQPKLARGDGGYWNVWLGFFTLSAKFSDRTGYFLMARKNFWPAQTNFNLI